MDEFVEGGTDPLTVSLYQMDLDRTQFLLRSYLRIRLQKVGISVHFLFLSVESRPFFVYIATKSKIQQNRAMATQDNKIKDIELKCGLANMVYGNKSNIPKILGLIKISFLQIEKHMFHILKTDELFNRLSKEEKVFAQR